MIPDRRPGLNGLLADMLLRPSRDTITAVGEHMAEARGYEAALLRHARERFGPLPPAIADDLTNILCLDILDYLFDHLYKCDSWEDLHRVYQRYQPDTKSRARAAPSHP